MEAGYFFFFAPEFVNLQKEILCQIAAKLSRSNPTDTALR